MSYGQHQSLIVALFFQIGSSDGILNYNSHGTSLDWAKGDAGIKWTFLVELPPTHRRGVHPSQGFILPSRHILPVVHSVFDGFKMVAAEIFNSLVWNMSALIYLCCDMLWWRYASRISAFLIHTAAKTHNYNAVVAELNLKPVILYVHYEIIQYHVWLHLFLL